MALIERARETTAIPATKKILRPETLSTKRCIVFQHIKPVKQQIRS